MSLLAGARHGWRARAYGKDGSLQSVWYNLSIFDVPPDFWTAAFRQGDGSKYAHIAPALLFPTPRPLTSVRVVGGCVPRRALLDEGVLERCDSSEGQAGQSDVLEGELSMLLVMAGEGRGV